ncbi:MAG TPA: M56 family metallopeptidase [Bryobacteraceae bacterium]|nr:M56 family metallopeptidase [Bryobacteraceae bacterium]
MDERSRRNLVRGRRVLRVPLVPPLAANPQRCPPCDKAANRRPLPAYSSPATLEPGVFGIFGPVLLLPEDLDRHLSPEQFSAVLAHESRHIRYRDNLTAAFHMLVEALFWFHPLVWWIGARLVEERERDCDEAALRHGSQPGDYARGIVSVCQSYRESPLPCASGISGADLKKPIREIMSWRGSLPISPGGKAILAAAAIAAISLPFAIGILRAQSLPPTPQYLYDTVSVHRSATS